MSILEKLSGLADRWLDHRAQRRARALMAALPPELQRDLGWPVMETYRSLKTRRMPR